MASSDENITLYTVELENTATVNININDHIPMLAPVRLINNAVQDVPNDNLLLDMRRQIEKATVDQHDLEQRLEFQRLKKQLDELKSHNQRMSNELNKKNTNVQDYSLLATTATNNEQLSQQPTLVNLNTKRRMEDETNAVDLEFANCGLNNITV